MRSLNVGSVRDVNNIFVIIYTVILINTKVLFFITGVFQQNANTV